jgi:AcrR family transcriptional regulator
MPEKTGKNEEARERSRAELLRAGAEMLVEHAQRNPFAGLRVRSLCERAGYSTGAFYMHWPTLDDYYVALTNFLTSSEEEMFGADFESLEDLADSSAGASTVTALTRVADRDIALLIGNTQWDANELVNVTWGRTRFRQQVAEGYKNVDRWTGKVYGDLLAAQGREPCPPLDWDRIGIVLQALVEGLGLRHRVDPAAVPGPSESAPGLYATAVAALLAVLTRRIGDDASVDETLQLLFAASGAPSPEK